MADTKLSSLAALTGANVDTANDLLYIDDASVTTSKKITPAELAIAMNGGLTTLVAANMGAAIPLTNTALFFDAPGVAQGTAGTWLVTGRVMVLDSNGGAGNSTIEAKLWDGTTVIASCVFYAPQTAVTVSSPQLSGVIANPAGNLRISVRNSSFAIQTWILTNYDVKGVMLTAQRII